jgi:hypothetical protein
VGEKEGGGGSKKRGIRGRGSEQKCTGLECDNQLDELQSILQGVIIGQKGSYRVFTTGILSA